MDLPLMIPRCLVRKMVSDAYKAGQLDQAREDARAVTVALKEVSGPQGLLLRQQDNIAYTGIGKGPDARRFDDCGNLVFCDGRKQ